MVCRVAARPPPTLNFFYFGIFHASTLSERGATPYVIQKRAGPQKCAEVRNDREAEGGPPNIPLVIIISQGSLFGAFLRIML